MLEYSKVFVWILYIALHQGMITYGQGNNFARTDNFAVSNSEKLDQVSLPISNMSDENENFKTEHRRLSIRLASPESSHSFEQYRSLNATLMPREIVMSPSIHLGSQHETNTNIENKTTSQAFRVVKSPIRRFGTMKTKYGISGKNPRLDNFASSVDNHQHASWNSQNWPIKTLDISESSRNQRSAGEAIHRRTQKARVAGYSVSNIRRRSNPQCPRLSMPTGASVTCTDGRRAGSTCTLSCRGGLVATGKRTRRCKARKHRKSKRNYKGAPYWTGKKDDFQCLPVCEHLDLPENGERECELVDTSHGKQHKCVTKCNKGYRIIGKPENFCEENGKWSDAPATCKEVSSTRQTPKRRFKFRKHQTLPCGEAYRLTSFRRNGRVYLVVGDKAHGRVKIFEWGDGKFQDAPFQTFRYPSPMAVEVVTAPGGTIWLIVGGEGLSTMYRMGLGGKFYRSHTTPVRLGSEDQSSNDAVAFAELRGEFYRCYGRNRRETPVIVVHKHTADDVFKRIMRKKLPGEKVDQCSMFTEGDSLYTVATLHKPDGQGRLMIGHLTRNRMKVVDNVSGKQMRHITGSYGFSIDGDRYIAVSQSIKNGQCIVYKRHWRTRPPEETG